MNKHDKVNSTLEYVFRHEYSKLISLLTVKFGTSNIDLIEDSVQESLYKAMRIWPYHEMPDEPGKWLYRVAHNKIIDLLRRSSKIIPVDLNSLENIMSDNTSFNMDSIIDDQLKMMFACCHPSMKEIEQIILCLKLLCGFSNKEIGKALLKEEEAIKKAVFRAKQKFKSEVKELEIPAKNELSVRLDSVFKVIYLLFNSGYSASSGNQVLNKEVCAEAIVLAEILYSDKIFNRPKLRALLALMYFNIARFDARINDQGSIVTMENQDRSLWDTDKILKGLNYFLESAEGEQVSSYHLESAIAKEYVGAKSFELIDWKAILQYYDYLEELNPNPISKLHRLVAVEKLHGPKIAFKQFRLLDQKMFRKNHFYFAIKADFENILGLKTYVDSLKMAIKLTENFKEKELLFSKI